MYIKFYFSKLNFLSTFPFFGEPKFRWISLRYFHKGQCMFLASSLGTYRCIYKLPIDKVFYVDIAKRTCVILRHKSVPYQLCQHLVRYFSFRGAINYDC